MMPDYVGYFIGVVIVVSYPVLLFLCIKWLWQERKEQRFRYRVYSKILGEDVDA